MAGLTRDRSFGGLDVVLAGGPDGRGGGDGPLVVLLHNYAAAGDDLMSVLGMLDVPAAVRFALPAGPVDVGPGYRDVARLRGWWTDDTRRRKLDALRPWRRDLSGPVGKRLAEARPRLTAALDEMGRALGVPGERTVIGGIGQGALLACDVALREAERPLAGLLLVSATLPDAAGWVPLMPRRRGLRVFQSHGRGDPFFRLAGARALRDELRAAGLDVTWVDFEGGHGLTDEAAGGASAFLRGLWRS